MMCFLAEPKETSIRIEDMVLKQLFAAKNNRKVDENLRVVIEPVVEVFSFDPSSDKFVFRREDDMRIEDAFKVWWPFESCSAQV